MCQHKRCCIGYCIQQTSGFCSSCVIYREENHCWNLNCYFITIWNYLLHISTVKKTLCFTALACPCKQDLCKITSYSHTSQEQQFRGHQQVSCAKQEGSAFWYCWADGGSRTEGVLSTLRLCVSTRVLKQVVFVYPQGGFVPNVFKVLSHRPAEFRAFFSYYNALMNKESGKIISLWSIGASGSLWHLCMSTTVGFNKSLKRSRLLYSIMMWCFVTGGLSKADRELIVVATSADNHCLYCVVSHSALHRIYSKKPMLADQVCEILIKHWV